ncbi:MAG TPA: hypothetical protein VJJ25_02465 [Nitrosopumilaceae archaeon]|nr:hypothetical protein [Nitrosopumilaceae archaeon]
MSEIHDLACRCYKDKRVWIMVSLVVFAGFVSSVFIFELDIGSNIIYAFLIFWGIILGALTFGMIEVIKHMKSFCEKTKSERDGVSLIAIGFVSAIVLIISLVIADNIQENYNYWITTKAIPYKEISVTEIETSGSCKIITTTTTKIRSSKDLWNILSYSHYESSSFDSEEKDITTKTIEDCIPEIPTLGSGLPANSPREIIRLNSNLPERMLTEDTWRKEITTLVDTQIEADEILYQVETMDQWNCDELWIWRMDNPQEYPLNIHNSQRMIDLGCQISDEQRNEYYKKWSEVD